MSLEAVRNRASPAWVRPGGWSPLVLARAAAALAIALLAAYLLSPAFAPVHPEGFTASVASLALHLNHDGVLNHDTIFPLNVEYFGLTKLGWLLAIAGLNWLGLGSAAALTVLTWLSAAIFAAGTMFLVRKWTEAPRLLIGGGLLLFAGAVETAFFFNDNLFSSALAVTGLCALYLRGPWLGGALSGLLFAAAVLTRTDTLLIGAAIPLIAAERWGVSGKAAATLAASGIAGAALCFGVLAAFNATPLDILTAASTAIAAWDRPIDSLRGFAVLVYFLSLPGLILVAYGIVPVLERRTWLEMGRLLLVPLLFLLPLWDTLWMSRQLLPLTPFLLALAIAGFRRIFSTRAEMIRKVAQVSFVLAAIATFLGPVAASTMFEGPRSLFGRIANTARWHAWQDVVATDFRMLASLVEPAEGRGPQVIVADSWNEDRYLHLALQEAGYSIRPPISPACAPVAERFVRGSQELYLVRPQHSFVPFAIHLAPERLRRWGTPCLTEVRPNTVTFVATAGVAERLFSARRRPSTDEGFGATMRDQALVAVPQDLRLDRLIFAYDRASRGSATPRTPSQTLEQAAAKTRAHTRFAD